MTMLRDHPERNVIRLQLKQNVVLQGLDDDDRAELEPHLVIVDGHKGDFLLHQGVREMEQYFILDGILKRVVSNQEGKEMILRFADEREMETSYAAWRLGTPTPYGIVCVTKARVARLPLRAVGRVPRGAQPQAKKLFEYCVMKRHERDHGAHHHAAPARRAGPAASLPAQASASSSTGSPSKELASYLNLSAETLSRLRHSGKV